MDPSQIKNIVKKAYGNIANKESCCGCRDASQTSRSMGYSEEEAKTPGNLGLGCGNPTGLGDIKEGETVLDLGSGAGFDAFLAAKKVGKLGKVIGVDMTIEMIRKAKENAKKHNYANVEFRLGDIENLPVENSSIDIIISNCVINLAPDKSNVFREACRVLKKGGRMFVSDIVLLREATEKEKNDINLIARCVSGASVREDYLKIITDAGLKYGIILENKEISKGFNIPLESLNIEIYKEK